MIAKTVTGSSFGGALAYGAGLRAEHTNKQAELLSVANVGSHDAAGIAAEMQAVAALSSRTQQPVWHTVLSWAPGEAVDRAQKLQAAALYCELIGASLARHQVAVYEHQDKAHPHLHIYINRVPIDGGAALDTAHNYARNVQATRQIRARLGMAPLPARRQRTKDLDPQQDVTRRYVREQLTAVLQDGSIRSLDQLVARLQDQQIALQLKRDGKGVLVGTSFRYQQTRVTGTDVGIKAQQLRDHFRSWGTVVLRPGTQAVGALSPGRGASPARASTDDQAPGDLFSRRDERGPAGNGAGRDDAAHKENEGRRRRRPKR